MCKSFVPTTSISHVGTLSKLAETLFPSYQVFLCNQLIDYQLIDMFMECFAGLMTTAGHWTKSSQYCPKSKQNSPISSQNLMYNSAICPDNQLLLQALHCTTDSMEHTITSRSLSSPCHVQPHSLAEQQTLRERTSLRAKLSLKSWWWEMRVLSTGQRGPVSL